MAIEISVVMNSFNHEAYISKAIESVLNQTFGNLELIIVDGGSKDKSREIIEAYRAKDERIRTIFHSRNFGIARATNDGINEAKGKFIAFIDSDDLWKENKLEKQLEILRKNEDLVVWSDGELIDGKDNPIDGGFVKLQNAEYKRKSGNILKDLLLCNFIFHSSLIVKRKAAANIGVNCQLEYLNDWLFEVELAEHFDYRFIKEPLSKYRIHGKNTISRNDDYWLKDYILIRRILLDKYKSEMPKGTKAQNLFHIGQNYALLNRMKEARQFVAKAIIASYWNNKSPYYLAAFVSRRMLLGQFVQPLDSVRSKKLKLKILAKSYLSSHANWAPNKQRK